MENATDILKIRYAVSPFDLETMSSHSRYVYELFPDGKVSYTHYERGNRTPLATSISSKASPGEYSRLCDNLNSCIATADRQNWYVDDCSATVKIYRPFMRTDTIDRGYGNSETDVGSLIDRYIYEIAGLLGGE